MALIIDIAKPTLYATGMTAEEITKEIQNKIGPQLQELGVEALCLAAYVKMGNETIQKIVIVASGGPNPAYADGLRGLAAFADRWGKGQL